jgi:hypothetical protein
MERYSRCCWKYPLSIILQEVSKVESIRDSPRCMEELSKDATHFRNLYTTMIKKLAERDCAGGNQTDSNTRTKITKKEELRKATRSKTTVSAIVRISRLTTNKKRWGRDL